MSSKKVFLHIGTHKTGTTSIQQFLSDYNSVLNKFDIGFFEGRFIRSNHVELHVAAMHPDRMSPIKHIRNLSPSAEFLYETKSAVRYFLEESSLKNLFFLLRDYPI